MTLEINAMNGVSGTSYTSSVGATEGNPDIRFQGYGPDENFLQGQITKEVVLKSISANKEKMELVVPFLFGEDHLVIAGDGKMTYGQLRDMLGIPPKVLSETNNKKLADNQVVKDIKVNLSDIGWYQLIPQDSAEAADYRRMRDYGDNYAGYDRSLSNEDIKKLFK